MTKALVRAGLLSAAASALLFAQRTTPVFTTILEDGVGIVGELNGTLYGCSCRFPNDIRVVFLTPRRPQAVRGPNHPVRVPIHRLRCLDFRFPTTSSISLPLWRPSIIGLTWSQIWRRSCACSNPGGNPIVIAESYKKGKYDKLQQPVMKLLKSAHLSVDEHRHYFQRPSTKILRCLKSARTAGFAG